MVSLETNFTFTWMIFGVVDAEQMFKPRPTSLAFQLSPKLLYTLAHKRELRKYMQPSEVGDPRMVRGGDLLQTLSRQSGLHCLFRAVTKWVSNI